MRDYSPLRDDTWETSVERYTAMYRNLGFRDRAEQLGLAHARKVDRFFGRSDTKGSLAEALRRSGAYVPRGWEGDVP